MALQTDTPFLPTRFTVVGGRADEPVPAAERPRVLLVTEGTYPHAWGGVSTWCDALVTVLPDVVFHIVSIIPAPDMAPVFTVPSNVVSVSSVPLWGVHDIKESWRGLSAASLARSRAEATDPVVAREFIGSFRRFLLGVLDGDGDMNSLAADIHAIYRYLRRHDLRETMHSSAAWATYVEVMQEVYHRASFELLLPELELWELTTGMQWVTRWLFPLADEIPEVDVVHAAMAGICTMVSVAAKAEHGAGFLLTEHGVYLRERYIAEAPRQDSYFLKLLGLRFARRMTELTYAMADQISPCCDYNGRWEREVGARPDQLQTIYYGVDSDAFSADRPISANPRTVVWVGRINPLKDVHTLLRAAALTLAVRPDAEFLLYGTAPEEDADYHQACLDLHAELELGTSVQFCGFTSDPAKAFGSGDLVVLSSISEGFPYSTLEAMLCGRPIVATSVGGLPEQIEGAGTVVEPRNPAAMADAIVELLNDPQRCAALGAAARERAMGEFGHAKFRGKHRTSYLSLSRRHSGWQTAPAPEAASAPAVSAAAVLPRQAVASEHDDSDARAELAQNIAARTPVPIDALEVAAVIESIGVTDRMARQSYGEADVFSLADRLFDSLTRERTARGVVSRSASDSPGRRRGGSRLDAARHPAWAVVPSLALLMTIWALATMGHWPATRVLALSVGMSAGMLSSNGLALAMGRRLSAALALGKMSAARRFFLACLALGLTSTLTITLGLTFVPWHPLRFLTHDRLVFVWSALVLTALWLTASALSLLAAAGAAGLSLCAGLTVGVALNYSVAGLTRYHLAAGVVTAVATTLGAMLWRLGRAAKAALADKRTLLQRLPSRGYLLVEAAPYFLYGTLASLMFISIHAVGWAYLYGNHVGIATLELGLFLPLAPAVLAAGRAERSLRAFWLNAADLQRGTPARLRTTFGQRLHRRYRSELIGYILRLVASSGLTAAVIEGLLRANVVARVVAYDNIADVRFLYIGGLFAYGLMAIAQFNTMFALSFLQHRRPLRALLAGILVSLLAGVWMAGAYGYQLLGVSLAVGALVYAVDSFTAVRPLLAEADRHYVATV